MRRTFSVVGLGILVSTAVSSQSLAQTTPALRNGSFQEWKDGRPVGWTVQIGARNGANSPESELSKGPGPSLQLTGKASTLAWNFVSQSLPAEPQTTFRLTFQAKVEGLKREGRQFDNCHVGFWPKSASGKGLGNTLVTVNSAEYRDYSVISRMPPRVATVDVAVFLSKTGTLNVKDVTVAEVAESESWDLLVTEMQERYSYFDHKKIDFPSLEEKYRQRAKDAKSKAEFADVVSDMLAEFKDTHTWVQLNGQRITKYISSFTPNYNFQVVGADLTDIKQVGSLGLVARTKDGFGYVRVTTLSNVGNQELRKFAQHMSAVFDAPGIIVDLRRNSGGSENVGLAIASLFADKKYVYARQKYRSGDGFVETEPRTIGPGRGNIYRKPVVCLQGPGAVSSAEGMTLMMKSLDHCTTVGQPTRGASGNPQPTLLPNGVDVWFSRWMALNPDGTTTEDVGVTPDVLVQHNINIQQDPAYEKAKQILASKK